MDPPVPDSRPLPDSHPLPASKWWPRWAQIGCLISFLHGHVTMLKKKIKMQNAVCNAAFECGS